MGANACDKDYYAWRQSSAPIAMSIAPFNLTTSLLQQLQDYYVKPPRSFIDTRKTILMLGILRRWRGKTDPWIDLALKPTSQFTSTDRGYLYGNAWNCFGISEVMLDGSRNTKG